MMHWIIAALARGGATVGSFLLSKNSTNTSVDADGQTVTGALDVLTDGSVDYTGDLFGTNETGSWWDPHPGTVSGTWHCRLSFVSGTNQYTTGSGLGTWLQCDPTGGSNRGWNFSKASAGGPDSTVGNYTLAFSDDAGSTTFDSVNIAITLQEQAP